MCGILCNGDNCKRGPLSQVGPGPPTCLIRPCHVFLLSYGSNYILFYQDSSDSDV